MDRGYKNKRLFGSLLEGNNLLPLTQKTTQRFKKKLV
jgi:hypothetical protein